MNKVTKHCIKKFRYCLNREMRKTDFPGEVCTEKDICIRGELFKNKGNKRV